MPQPQKQIVNLASQPEPRRESVSAKKPDPLDEMYKSGNSKTEAPWQKIARPGRNQSSFDWIKILAGIIALVVVTFLGYSVLVRNWAGEKPAEHQTASSKIEPGWFMVKLTDGEIFYGQIGDLSANPLKVEKVYYNYDKEKLAEDEGDQATGLRLVKRGKEAHGPSGELAIYQAQVVFLEPLRADSRVLQAINEYEK